MLGGIGMPELLIILVIILIIFGTGKLPEIGSALGKGIKNFKKATTEKEDLELSSPKLEKAEVNKEE
jgi:sec-independent protein translocase protein TatA